SAKCTYSTCRRCAPWLAATAPDRLHPYSRLVDGFAELVVFLGPRRYVQRKRTGNGGHDPEEEEACGVNLHARRLNVPEDHDVERIDERKHKERHHGCSEKRGPQYPHQ